MGVKFRPPPLPLLLVLVVFLLGISAWFKHKPNFPIPGHGKFVTLTVLALVATVVIYVVHIKLIFPMLCSLFCGPRRVDKYDAQGEYVGSDSFNENCGKTAVGRVKVLYDHCKRIEFFCKDHDPEIGWMKEWLRKRGLKIDSKTIRRFSNPAGDDDFDINDDFKF